MREKKRESDKPIKAIHLLAINGITCRVKKKKEHGMVGNRIGQKRRQTKQMNN